MPPVLHFGFVVQASLPAMRSTPPPPPGTARSVPTAPAKIPATSIPPAPASHRLIQPLASFPFLPPLRHDCIQHRTPAGRLPIRALQGQIFCLGIQRHLVLRAEAPTPHKFRFSFFCLAHRYHPSPLSPADCLFTICTQQHTTISIFKSCNLSRFDLLIVHQSIQTIGQNAYHG